jgi:poly(3-hydroxybutyrate) depolymerase
MPTLQGTRVASPFGSCLASRACRDGQTGGDQDARPDRRDSGTQPPQVPPGMRPGTNELTLTSGGIERRALVHVPAEVNPGRRLAVVFNLHGSGSNPEEQMARSGLAATADEQDFVVAAPQGGVGGGTGWAWNVPHVTTAPGAREDQAFINDLIDVLASTGCTDPVLIGEFPLSPWPGR